MSNRPSAAPIEVGNASVTTYAIAAPFMASTRPNIASIAADGERDGVGQERLGERPLGRAVGRGGPHADTENTLK
jgi:hypothetical protein